jgi:peptidyl-prolyl cis-trans isomerase A (cyclophilin A)
VSDPDRATPSGVRSGLATSARQHVIVAAAHEVTLNATLQAAPIVSSITVVTDDPSRSPLVFPSEVAVRLNTGIGNIVIAVDATRAPITAANFLKYVDSGFYDRGRFHRATRAENYTPNLPNRPLLEVIQAGINPSRKSKAFPLIPLERTSITG